METGTKTKSNYDLFVSAMKRVEDIEKIVERKPINTETDKREEDYLKMRKYAYDSLPQDARNQMKEGEMDPTAVDNGVKSGLKVAREEYSNFFRKNLDSILNDIPEESLQRLSKEKEIVKEATNEQKQVLGAYAEWKAQEDLLKRYQEGKTLSDEENKFVHNFEADGLADKVANEFKKYSTDVQESMKSLALYLLKTGKMKDTREYGFGGLAISIEGRKKDYEELSNKHGDVKKISRGILKEISTPDNVEGTYTARKLIYESNKESK